MRFLVAALSLSVLSPRALACECEPLYESSILVADQAPPNAEPLVIYSLDHGEVEIDLLEAAGLAPVLQVTTTWDMGSTVVSRLEPLEPLDEGGEYYVRVSATVAGEGDDSSDWSVIASQQFAVSGAADDAAPGEVSITAISAEDSEGGEASCEPSRWINLDISPVAGESLVFYQVEVSASEDLADAAQLVYAEPSAAVGADLCRSTWGGIEAGGTYWVRARALDGAGNAGDWSEPATVTLVPTYPGDTGGGGLAGDEEPADGGGGSKDGGCGGESLIALGLGALLARRRR